MSYDTTCDRQRTRVSKPRNAKDLSFLSAPAGWALKASVVPEQDSLAVVIEARPKNKKILKMAGEMIYGAQFAGNAEWSFTSLDGGSRNDIPRQMQSFLDRAPVEAGPRGGITSFLSDIATEHGEGWMTMRSNDLLSTNAIVTELAAAAPSFATSTNIPSHPAEYQNHSKIEEAREHSMAPLKRVKYKEATAFAPVKHEQEQPEQERTDQAKTQVLEETRPCPRSQPHTTSTTHTTTAIHTSEAAPAAAAITTHGQLTDLQTAKHVANLAESSSPALKTLVPYSSSSAPSSHPSTLSVDSAVEMGGKGHGRKTQSPGVKDPELISKGRNFAEPSNATTTSLRYDKASGTLVDNITGDSWAPKHAEKSSRQENEWAPDTTGGWDTEHPPLPTKARANATAEQHNQQSARTNNKPFNHNGRVRIEPKPRKPRESPWIKDSDIPKGDPKRHKTRWSSPERDSSSYDSNRTSSGWGTRRKRNGEGAELADWAGGIGPASIDWDSRSQFRDHQSAARIEAWLEKTCSELKDVEPIKLTSGGPTFTFIPTSSGGRELVKEEQGSIAPHYWYYPQLDQKPADIFWAVHLDKESPPMPVDEEDAQDSKPWWEYYFDGQCSMLRTLEHPTIKGIDPDETQAERLAREHDNGGANAAANRRAAEQAKKKAERKRRQERIERAHQFNAARNVSQASTTLNGIKPGLKIFLRSARREDMVHLRDIYNRYIDNAYVVPETDRLTETDMLNRWKAMDAANLPFIVACQRGEKIKGRKIKGNIGDDMTMPDKVVGFACAADWTDEASIYRPTVKLEIFVNMEQYMNSVGSCLADQMMGLLDPSFLERGGYETVGEELDGVGPARVVSNVMVRYLYEAQKPDKMKWVTTWMKNRFGFEKVADLQHVAHKFDKQYVSSSQL